MVECGNVKPRRNPSVLIALRRWALPRALPPALATTGILLCASAAHAAEQRSQATATAAADVGGQVLGGQVRDYWAVGIGLSAIGFHDYIGADEGRLLVLPFPYVAYESRHLRVDRDAISGILPVSERLRFKLSFSGALPVDSNHNSARRGMDDLDAVGEAGPAVEYRLAASASGNGRLTVEVPFRAAIAASFSSVEPIGWTSNPSLEYNHEPPGERTAWRWTLGTGPMFATASFFNYTYRVRSRDITPERPKYSTDGGYGGWRVYGSVSKRTGDIWAGAFVRAININGAVFEDSPLVRQKNYLMAGVGISWIFAGSEP